MLKLDEYCFNHPVYFRSSADPSFVEAVEGLEPSKDRHEFFLDVVPRLGLPFAAQPRYQLNVVIGSSVDPEWAVIAAMQKELVLPLLWGQEGFPGPTPEMVTLTKVGLDGPRVLAIAVSAACFATAAVLLAVSAVHLVRRVGGWTSLGGNSNSISQSEVVC